MGNLGKPSKVNLSHYIKILENLGHLFRFRLKIYIDCCLNILLGIVYVNLGLYVKN